MTALGMAAWKAVRMVGSMAENSDSHLAAHWAATSADWTAVSLAGWMVAMTARKMAAMMVESSVVQ